MNVFRAIVIPLMRVFDPPISPPFWVPTYTALDCGSFGPLGREGIPVLSNTSSTICTFAISDGPGGYGGAAIYRPGHTSTAVTRPQQARLASMPVKRSQRTVTSDACTYNRSICDADVSRPSSVTLAGDPSGATPSNTTWSRLIGGSSDRTSIVWPFRAALNMMYTVAEPPVASAAISASRSEMPSVPVFALSAATEDTSPFTTSAVVVTTTTLLDTAGGGGTGADEARMSVDLNVTLLAAANNLTRYCPTLTDL